MVTLLANVGLDRDWSFLLPCITLCLLSTLSSWILTCLLALLQSLCQKRPQNLYLLGYIPQLLLLCPQGLRKRELLKELLPVIGQNLRFQRLFTECQEQLDILRDK